MSTTIEWTQMPGYRGETWNPIRARNKETGKLGWFCTKPSEGCTNCYADSMNVWRGNGLAYRVGNLDKVSIELANLAAPLRWRDPRSVFPCSMTDLFHEAHTDQMIASVYAVMALTGRHNYKVLTKRPARRRELLNSDAFIDLILDTIDADDEALWRLSGLDDSIFDTIYTFNQWIASGEGWPLPNVWEGVTTENQRTADERIPELAATPASLRWISAEPLLESIDIDRWLDVIDWVVPGLESGVKARIGHLGAIEHLIAQCVFAGVPVFNKQLGRRPVDDREHGDGQPLQLKDIKGGDISEWPLLLRIRQWPARIADVVEAPDGR